ncbi:DUF2263 domain-containing protein [Favolaschia claudopus]|uniref:DUF2263 domain-containing protein n=1 Tax=Favolaschia claudopus TaxID=2862362 RepID=A0AAW0E209_9AGAR
MPHPVLAKIADDTLAAVRNGRTPDIHGTVHPLKDLSIDLSATEYYPPDSSLSSWASANPSDAPKAELVLRKCSTLQGVQHCVPGAQGKIGVLNFASATREGGGFISGASAQEESIARSSTLYSSLITPTAQRFYHMHRKETKSKYYTHAMIYTRGVQIFRTDKGNWVPPTTVDVLTSAAVNAGVVRSREGGGGGGHNKGKKGAGIKAYFKPINEPSGRTADTTDPEPPKDVEKAIEDVMRERMGRLLFLFEKEGVQDLVLGSFGTGVFQNKVPMVAKLWIELLAAPNARFKNSFQRAVFAIIDQKTCGVFKDVFVEHEVEFTDNSLG